MVGARLSGCVVKYSADRGVGVIKPLLHSEGIFFSSGEVAVHVKPTDRFFFDIEDVCIAGGEKRLQSMAKTEPTALFPLLPLLPVGGIVLFALQRRVSSPNGILHFNDMESHWANHITMDETSPRVSSQYLDKSAWLAWKADQRRVDHALQEGVWRKGHISDDVRLDSVIGIPIDL